METTRVLTNGTVFTMGGQGVLERGSVVIAGTAVTGVYEAGRIPVEVQRWIDENPAAVEDITGRYVLPGLINLHDHLDMHEVPGTMHDRVSKPIPALAARGVRNALLALSRGVTTLRDLGSMGGTNIEIRDAVDQGLFIGPRILACGAMISITGGHGQPLCAEADGADGMRRVTRLQHKAGADVIKICASGGVVAMPREDPWALQMSDDEIRAVVEEASRFGLRVASHAQPPAAIQASVRAGVTTIEHGAFLDDETAALMAEAGTYLVPTIDDSFAVAENGALHGRPPWMVENARNSIPLRQASLARAVREGVRLGVGTDVVGRMGREMLHMVEAGLDVMSAIAAGTSTAAEIVGDDRIGVIEAGREADLVVLDDDPRQRLTAFDDAIRSVYRAGVHVDPVMLKAACGGGGVR